MNGQPKAGSVLDEIARLVAEEAVAVGGLDADLARSIGFAAADKISQHLGGQPLYITRDLAIAKRHREIWHHFTGDNYAELARMFSLAEPYVRQVVARMRSLDRQQRQRDLFSSPASNQG